MTDKINPPKKYQIANLPTPIEHLEKLSAHLGGADIFIKRDDYTESGMSGNKIRKLEFSVAEALRQNADTLITTGGIQSNHCRTTAIAARRAGLGVSLVLRGEAPEIAQGNLLLDHVAGAEITWITPEQYKNNIFYMEKEAERLASEGRKAYIIAEGASDAVGAWGYISAAAEIAAQCRDAGLEFDAIFNAVGSGGTTAGLAVGFARENYPLPVKSVAVCDGSDYFRNKIDGILHDWSEKYALEIPKNVDYEVIEGYIGPGYAIPYPEVIDTIKTVARLEGIFFDPVYTGKAAWCLFDQTKKGMWKKGRSVLFLHTGGIFSLFAYSEELRAGAGADY